MATDAPKSLHILGLNFVIARVDISITGSGIFVLPQNLAMKAFAFLDGGLITDVGVLMLAIKKFQCNHNIYAYPQVLASEYVGCNAAWGDALIVGEHR